MRRSKQLNSAQVTIFAVVKKTSATTAAFVVTKAASAIWPYALELNASSTATFRLNNAIPTDTGTLANNTYGVEEGVYNETAAQLYVNGILSKSTAYTKALVATNADPVAIGGESAGNSLDGDIAEVLIYNTGLTTPERQQVEAYLYQKYGLGTQPTAPSPALSLGAGIYPAGQTITLTPTLAGDILYYTTDGTTPTADSTEYTGPLTINTTTTLRVIEVSPGFINSPVVSAVYTIDATSHFPRTGLVAWLRADVGLTLNGNTVSQWADQSGNANDATQTAAIKQPTLVNGALNGLPVLQFNSANNSYISIPNGSTLNGPQVSVFAVVKKTSATTSAFVVSKATASSWPYALEINGSNSAALRLNSAITTDTGTLANGTYGVEEGIYNQTDAQLYVNGVLGQSTAYTTGLVTNNTGPVSIGGEAGKVSLAGDIAEVLVYNTGLTALQRQQVEAYFFLRYGLGTQPTAPVPTFSLASGTYGSAEPVTLVPALAGDSIYYTTNGTTPTAGSTKFTVPVTISATTTLRTIEVSPGFINSPVVSEVYTIDPASIFTRTGLVAWLRTDVGVTRNGSAVSQWNDQSGHGNNAVQATGSKQPTLVNSALNGEPVLQFTSAANSYLAIPKSSTLNGTQLTVIAVVKKTSATTSASVVSKAVSSTWPYALNLNGSSSATLRVNTGATTDTGTLANSTYGVEAGVYNQTDAQLFVNGVLGQSTAYTKALLATNTDPVSIGGESTGNSLDGDIAEVLIYNTALTTQQRQDVEAYLYEKYGVGTLIPAPSPGVSPAAGIYSGAKTVTLTPG